MEENIIMNEKKVHIEKWVDESGYHELEFTFIKPQIKKFEGAKSFLEWFCEGDGEYYIYCRDEAPSGIKWFVGLGQFKTMEDAIKWWNNSDKDGNVHLFEDCQDEICTTILNNSIKGDSILCQREVMLV